MRLFDGSVLPSFLKPVYSQDYMSGQEYSFSDYVLRVGYVYRVYNPDDEKNFSKKYVEYDVYVFHADKNGVVTKIPYYHVVVTSLFGGAADRFRYTLRIDNNQDGQINYSSRVMVLCANGNNRLAYIIGSIPHPNTIFSDETFESGALDWEYNGVFANINKDGELGLYRKGATDNSGKFINAQNNISTITFDKDGKINIGYVGFNQNAPDSTFTDSTPFISLDQNNNNITINGNTDLTATVTNNFQINSNTFKINGGKEALLNATTYRQQQQQMHQQISSSLESLTALINLAGTQFITAGTTMVAPVTGAVLAAPMIGIAGGALISAVSAISDILIAIQNFEALTEEYLSKNNFQSDPE